MKVETQTRILSILIMLLIILVVILSVLCSGMLDDKSDVSINGGGQEWDTELDEMPPANNMYLKVSGNEVICRYTSNQSADVSWSFGDGTGAINKNEVIHTYPDSSEDNIYIITMHVVEDFGRSYTEISYVQIEANTLVSIPLPETSNEYRIYTISLLLAGITSIIFAITMFWVDIPPQAFTQRLRVIVGVSFILCYGIATGFFNGLVGG